MLCVWCTVRWNTLRDRGDAIRIYGRYLLFYKCSPPTLIRAYIIHKYAVEYWLNVVHSEIGFYYILGGLTIIQNIGLCLTFEYSFSGEQDFLVLVNTRHGGGFDTYKQATEEYLQILLKPYSKSKNIFFFIFLLFWRLCMDTRKTSIFPNDSF